VYNKTNILGLTYLPLGKVLIIASSGRYVEMVWTNFKAILHQGIEKFFPHKIPRKNSDTEYYNREV
jgi:hypothetical protein